MTISDEQETRLLEKATYVEEAVTVLSRKQTLDEETYRTDREQRAIVEREFQTAIEACLDMAGILIKRIGEPMPETNAGRFERLVNSKFCLQRRVSECKTQPGFEIS